MDFSKLKGDARKSLEGHYKDAIIISVLYGALVYVFNGVGMTTENTTTQMICSIIELILACLFTLGYTNYFLKLSRNEKVGWNELFSKTNLAFDVFIISIVVAVFVTLWSLLLIIPGIIAGLSYSQVFYLKLDNPDMDVMELINESKRMMKGHKMDLFLLSLSFLGWIILGVFTLFILYFWLVPYINTTMCNFYNEIKDEKK